MGEEQGMEDRAISTRMALDRRVYDCQTKQGGAGVITTSDSEICEHKRLVARAKKWLVAIGCGVELIELATINGTGEIPDAIGWRSGVSILIEVKRTRADFLSDRKKQFRKAPEKGMGDWRFYFCPPGLILPEELPVGWGLLYAHPKTIERVCGAPKSNQWYIPPFDGNKRAENAMLYGALRRLKLRGHLDQIYLPLSPLQA